MLERSGNERTTTVSPQRCISDLLVTRGSGGGHTEGQVWRKLMQITTSHIVSVACFRCSVLRCACIANMHLR